MRVIDTDYLIIGAGAAGMAFADALIADSDADVVMVERRHCSGGHWNDAYPFVRIHHTSTCYGVNSRILGTDSIDETGPNAGHYECASAVEVCAYYQRVLEEVLLPSGQVRFFGMCDYVGDWADVHVFTSRVTGTSTTVHVRRKIVDTTYLDVTVPATHTPSFTANSDVKFIPPGELVNLAERPTGYTIVGSGKTAMDACSWLLNNGEDPDRIRWIRPRDAWSHDRMTLQPRDLVTETIHGLSLGIEALAQSEAIDELWPRVEACGQLQRFDPQVTPTMYRGAILSAAEYEGLKQIERVVRLGRVQSLGLDRIVLEEGEIPTDQGQIHVDCTARGYHKQPIRAIFEPQRIVIQSLIGVVQTYYAAMLGFIESTGRDDTEKNRLCPPVAQVDEPLDWIRFVHGVLYTSALHSTEPDIMAWQGSSRLNLTRGMENHMGEPRMQVALERWGANAEQAVHKAKHFLAETPSPG
jgi:hypothetical protein